MFLTNMFWRGPVMLLAMIGSGLGATLEGTLYSNESGASGRGAGEIRIFVDGRILEIFYRKPLRGEFASPGCYEPGSIWSVDLKGEVGINQEIASVVCKGPVEAPIHDAWMLVKNFLAALPQDTASAIGMLSQDWRRTPEFRSIQNKLVALDLDGYYNFGSMGRCLSVIAADRSGSVDIDAGDNCYVHSDHSPTTIHFDVSTLPAPTIRRIHFQ